MISSYAFREKRKKGRNRGKLGKKKKSKRKKKLIRGMMGNDKLF